MFNENALVAHLVGRASPREDVRPSSGRGSGLKHHAMDEFSTSSQRVKGSEFSVAGQEKRQLALFLSG